MAKSDAVADIAIIGSGIACTSTLIAIFERLLLGSCDVSIPLQIIVIERYAEKWKGIPYGERSSVNALTITTLQDFFTAEAESKDFFDWFLPAKDQIFSSYLKKGGVTAANWFKDNEEAIIGNCWDKVYLPRFIIGDYILQKFTALKTKAEAKKLVHVTTIQGEVIAVKDISAVKQVSITLQNKVSEILTKKVVLAIGSAPERKLTDRFNDQKDILYINNLYDNPVEEIIRAIKQKLVTANPSDRNILIIGSNAACIELLYLLYNYDDITGNIENITLLSSGGKLPGDITYRQNNDLITTNLNILQKAGSYKLEQLVNAASADLLKTITDEISVSDVDIIMGRTLQILGSLTDDDKKSFYAIYGVQLAKIFRRSGADYKKAVKAFTHNKKLKIIKGNFTSFKLSNSLVNVSYNNGIEDKSVINAFKIVINCTGSENLENSSSPLIQDLIKNNGWKVNRSGKAFEVAANLEAAPGIYVIGPLAGGNYNKLLHFWHIENASRIMYLSKHLAQQLLD